MPRGSMRQGPWEYRRGVLGVLQAFHVWLEGREARSKAQEIERPGRTLVPRRRRVGLCPAGTRLNVGNA